MVGEEGRDLNYRQTRKAARAARLGERKEESMDNLSGMRPRFGGGGEKTQSGKGKGRGKLRKKEKVIVLIKEKRKKCTSS